MFAKYTARFDNISCILNFVPPKFNEFEKENNTNDTKLTKERNQPPRGEIKQSLKALTITWKNIQIEFKFFIGNSVRATMETLYDIGLFDKYVKHWGLERLLNFQQKTKMGHRKKLMMLAKSTKPKTITKIPENISKIFRKLKQDQIQKQQKYQEIQD